jgi:aspartate racemase
MKRIGIIGGIGPESTIDYYKRIISAFQKRPSPIHPEIIVKGASLASSDTSALRR